LVITLPTGGFFSESLLRQELHNRYLDALAGHNGPDFERVYPLILEQMEKVGWKKRTLDNGSTEYFKTS